MKCEKVNIEIFMDAWFNQDFEKLSKDDFDIVYAEYIDLSGLYQTKEFELAAYINYLKNRIYTIQSIIYSQGVYYEVFKQPYLEGIEFVKDSFGLNFIWNGSVNEFFSFVRKLKNIERNKSSELRRKEFEFNELKQKKVNNDMSNIQPRHEFIKMLNSFNKNGYRIERDKTTVEELALMIKQIQDESTELARNRVQR